MREAKNLDVDNILNFLKADMVNNLYAYIDIKSYGLEHPEMKVWLNESDTIQWVVMKYYESFQICGKIEKDMESILSLIKQYEPKMISGKEDTIRQLVPALTRYKATYGKIFEVDRYLPQMGNQMEVEAATSKDMDEIAALICSDEEIGGHYDVKVLSQQLQDRQRSGMGRNFVIRQNGTIIAHTATYAECENVAVTGGTIISKAYRNSPCYSALSNKLLQELNKEQKRIYTFATSEKMIRYHTRMHSLCASYGKLTYK